MTSIASCTFETRKKCSNLPRGFCRTFSLLKCLGLGAGLAAAFVAKPDARADSTWTGATNQDYNNGANWSNGFPSGQNAIINTATGNYPIISFTPTSGIPVDIFVGRSGTGRLDQTAGNAGTGNGNWFFLGTDGGGGNGNGTFNLADTSTTGGATTGFGQGSGSFTAGRLHIGGGQFNGHGTGTMNVNTSGTVLATGGNNNGVNVGITVGFDAGDVGTLNIDNGTVNGAVEMYVGNSGAMGTVNQAGGTLNNQGYIGIGRLGGTGVYNLTGGTVNQGVTVNGGDGFGFTTIGSGGGSTGTLNVSGTANYNSAGGMILGEGWTGTGTSSGTLTISGSATVSLGANVLNMGTTNTGGPAVGNGTVNLNGGSLQTGGLARGGGTATVNFNGGTLQAMQASATFMQDLTAANVLAGGAKINTNGFDITVGQALVHGGAGADGGLAKSGAGQLELTAASTFTGPTSVTAGTLLLSTGSINSSTTVSVTGTGALTLQNTTALADSATLSLASGTTLNLNATSGNEVINYLVLNGNVQPAGTYTFAQLQSMSTLQGDGVTFTGLGETLTVAVPEPATWAAGLLALGAIGYRERRRVQSWLRRTRVA